METEELFTQIQDKLEGKYYDKKTFRLIKKMYKEIIEPKKKKSHKIILPFYGYIFQDKCFGIKKNYNLYTQCARAKTKDCEYCKSCLKQCEKTKDNKPLYGDIRDRKEQWCEELTWKPKNCTKEVPFIDVVEKLQLDLTKIKNEIKKLKWRDIPECHLIKKEKKKKRIKKHYHLCSSDEE